MYGPHLILDGYKCQSPYMSDKKEIELFILGLIDTIKMTQITPVKLVQYLDPPEPMWGISAQVMIAESHIAVHTYPALEIIFADIFLCKPFDIDVVKELFQDVFMIEEPEWTLVERGKRFRDIVCVYERDHRMIKPE